MNNLKNISNSQTIFCDSMDILCFSPKKGKICIRMYNIGHRKSIQLHHIFFTVYPSL